MVTIKVEAFRTLNKIRQSVERAESALRQGDTESLREEMHECRRAAAEIEDGIR
jgi:mevalonate kinase